MRWLQQRRLYRGARARGRTAAREVRMRGSRTRGSRTRACGAACLPSDCRPPTAWESFVARARAPRGRAAVRSMRPNSGVMTPRASDPARASPAARSPVPPPPARRHAPCATARLAQTAAPRSGGAWLATHRPFHGAPTRGAPPQTVRATPARRTPCNAPHLVALARRRAAVRPTIVPRHGRRANGAHGIEALRRKPDRDHQQSYVTRYNAELCSSGSKRKP